ncbi:o-succinylbenzoate synthase [Vibrio sp. SS-MA-C1-2]|uniref:o-succinylbenzoate synthase n=1 Tax=Vibrio sp. SS-MA-C1-2 TaxID=2908646 RepID=UPI001F432E73|nr:o-succinylbenzoate synthase [Vibrio sp. SS-MA-C1-2]UJF19951.1 o-succinylbenzoate synthase [Vibrio sp. SS-MA-C1-2]
MRSVKLYQYSLPMDSGVILRNQRLATREGWIIELNDGDMQAFGEVAPLPEFSEETFEQAGQQLQQILNQWVNRQPELTDLYPSVAFGFSMAKLELANGLPAEANYRVAPLCSGDPDELVERLSEMSGDKVAKIKVGMYEAVRDGMVANMFLEAIPELKLRLDANRGWTPLKSQQFAKYVNPQYRDRIAFIEEPCHTPEQSLHFAEETGIAIAWDETVRDEGFIVKADPRVSAIVIKPTLVGSIAYCLTLIEQAKSLGLDVVISSSLESSLGLTQLARFAQWQLPEMVPGLDTMQLFQSQLVTAWPDCSLPITTLEQLTLAYQQNETV